MFAGTLAVDQLTRTMPTGNPRRCRTRGPRGVDQGKADEWPQCVQATRVSRRVAKVCATGGRLVAGGRGRGVNVLRHARAPIARNCARHAVEPINVHKM